MFSIILKDKAQFNILDLSECNQTTLDLFADQCIHSYSNSSSMTRKESKPVIPTIFKSIQNSSFLLLIACVSHQDEVPQLEHTLSYASNIYEKTAGLYNKSDNNRRSSLTTPLATKHNNKSQQNNNDDDSEYLRRIIIKLTNEVNTLRHHRNRVLSTSSASTTVSDARHASMFSSISNSTSMTIPEEEENHKVCISATDLKRQVEELENQVTVTRERNTHVERELITNHEIQEKQWQLIDGLEYKLNEMEQLNQDLQEKLLKENETTATMEKEFESVQREMAHLGNERYQLDQVFNVMENRIQKRDQDNTQALQEITELKTQFEQELNKKNEEIEELTFQLRHNKPNSNKIMMMAGDSSANSSDIMLTNPCTLALESKIEELDSYIEHIRSQRDHYNDQLEERIDEADKLQHAFVMQAAKAYTLEKRVADLEQELQANQLMVRQGDISGMVERLEQKIHRLEQEKLTDEQDFEISYEDALNEIETLQQKLRQQEEQVKTLNGQLDEKINAYIQKEEELLDLTSQFNTVQKLNLEIKAKMESYLANRQQQQEQGTDRKLSNVSSSVSALALLKQRSSIMDHRSRKQSLLANYQPIDQVELLKWAQEKMNTGETTEIIQKLAQLSDENAQLALWIGDLEGQVLSQRHHLSQEAKNLEVEVMNLTVVNNQLEREIEHLYTKANSRSSERSSLPPPTAKRNTNRGSCTRKLNKVDYLDVKRNSAGTTASMNSDVSALRWSTATNNNNNNRSTTPNVPPPALDPPNYTPPPVPTLSYIPNNNSTSPLPLALQQQKVIVPPTRNSSRKSADSSSLVVGSHNEAAADNNNNKQQQLESQLAAYEAEIKQQRQEIENLLEEQETLHSLKNKVAMTHLELKNERALKQKAEKAHLILEKRLEDLMNNKKNKYRCF